MRFRNVLYAEDDPNDVIMFRMACKKATLPMVLHTAGDGQAAVDWLSGKGEYADREKFPFPDVVILDLKMPKKNGFEVLEWLRSQQAFEKMPVIILSSSDMPEDVEKAYRLGASTYFVKSIGFQDVLNYLGSPRRNDAVLPAVSTCGFSESFRLCGVPRLASQNQGVSTCFAQ